MSLDKYNGEMKAHMRLLTKLCMRSLATCLLNLPSMLLCCCFQWMLIKRQTCFQRRHLIQVCINKYIHFLSPQTGVFGLTEVEGCGSHSNSSQGVCVSEAYPHKRETNHGFHCCCAWLQCITLTIVNNLIWYN